ncbi:SET domain [Trypanosoma melophagium]|uniref:SET domain n=1 Tax=Trypanosoma melophagium TaxID=715481 RepID=UPI00351A9EAA|nr:SET domain [Trypanosoma melophagium]
MSHAGPSLLLRNLHCTLPAIGRLYEGADSSLVGVAGGCRRASSPITLPREVSTREEGEAVLDFFCQELNMGASSLRRWRSGLAKAVKRRWWSGETDKNPKIKSGLLPKERDDLLFVRSAMGDLKAIVSPFLTLAPSQTQGITYGSSFVATRRILPAVFLLSLPVAAVFFAQPPPSADPVTSFFMHVEDLVGQLVVAGSGSEPDGWCPSHAGYVDYLKKSVVPSNNLPFLEKEEIIQLLKEEKKKKTISGNKSVTKNNLEKSPAVQLWEYFHDDMNGLPLTAFLRERLSKEEYAWWVSLVLSRRSGAATLIPVVDKLNHHPEPNCYYTMSTEESFCGIDVFDNLLAGVPSDLLYEPYLHTFSIREIHEGEELTLCYASPTLHGKQSGSTSGGISVTSPEGRAAWQVQWGFIPEMDSPYSSDDLKEVATIVAERRVDLRQMNFPPDK